MEINGKFITATDVSNGTSFHYDGCENCASGLGCDVHAVTASSQNINTGKWTEYPILLCHECVMANNYSDPLPENCENIYKI